LLAYQVDVGVVTLPCEGLVTARLLCDEMLAVVPADHPLATAPCLPVARLADEPFLMSAGGCEPLIRSIFQATGLAPRVVYRIRDMSTLLAMVQEGLGVTMAPTLALALPQPGLVAVRLDPPVERHLALGVRAVPSTAPAMTAFIQTAQDLVRYVDSSRPAT
jgi:DNA-binding transcriptional LysR family regulator